jgi:hypothetical protein
LPPFRLKRTWWAGTASSSASAPAAIVTLAVNTGFKHMSVSRFDDT